jgi:hypothetical protein
VNAIGEIQTFIGRNSVTCDYLLMLEQVEHNFPALFIAPRLSGGWMTAITEKDSAVSEGFRFRKDVLYNNLKALFDDQQQNGKPPVMKGLIIRGEPSELVEIADYLGRPKGQEWRPIMAHHSVEQCMSATPVFIQNQYDPFDL